MNILKINKYWKTTLYLIPGTICLIYTVAFLLVIKDQLDIVSVGLGVFFVSIGLLNYRKKENYKMISLRTSATIIIMYSSLGITFLVLFLILIPVGGILALGLFFFLSGGYNFWYSKYQKRIKQI